MRYYIIVFLLVLIMSSAITNIQAPSSMPCNISDIKPISHGLIRDQGGIGDIRITDSARAWRYTTEINAKHPGRDSDFPFFGNN